MSVSVSTGSRGRNPRTRSAFEDRFLAFCQRYGLPRPLVNHSINGYEVDIYFEAERVIVERTELDEKGGARGTGETYEVPASLVVSSIGYSTPPIEGVPYDERGGKFLNERGRVADQVSGSGLFAR